MIAHEINNLLTPLASYADLALKNRDDTALTEKALEKAVRNCERATRIMESVLTLAQGQEQEKQDVRLSILVEEVFTCLCRDLAKDGITVQIQIPEDFSAWVVPVQIQQVLMNLILNAREAMLPRGGILNIKSSQDADATHIEVTDTGGGIAPAGLQKVFEQFYSTKTKDTDARQCSSGLGLAFCKKVVEAHNGCISVESQVDKGTTFRITLPKPPLRSSRS
jgi:signal transduction histidine kinase